MTGRALPIDLATYAASPLAWRWKAIERLGGALARHSRYFCALDECSLPAAILGHPGMPAGEGARRVAALAAVVPVLVRRLDARAHGRLDAECLDARSTLLAALEDAVRAWSRVQTTLSLHFYGAGERALDLQLAAEAFLLFASGELRLPIVGRRGIGEPDGAYYFAFAEFALLACDLRIDRDLWEPQLAHLVWTQEVYVHMQRPVGAPPHRFHEYAPRGRERRWNPLVAEAARARVRGLRSRAELEEVHTQHCREAFGDRQPAARAVRRRSGTPSPTA